MLDDSSSAEGLSTLAITQFSMLCLFCAVVEAFLIVQDSIIQFKVLLTASISIM